MSVRSDHGGGPFHVNQILYSLPRSTFNLFIAAPNSKPFGMKWKKVYKDKYFYIPHRKYSFRIMVKIILFIKQNNIQIVHSHGKGAGIYSRLLKLVFMKRIKCIHTFHGLHISKDSFSYLAVINKYLEKILSKFTDTAIFVSKEEKNSATLNKILYRKSYVVYNGIDPPSICKIKKNNDKDKFIILSISRFDYSKNMMFAFDIAKNLIHEKNIEFVWVGDGPDKKLIEEKSKVEKISNIKYIGFTEKVHDYLSKSDILLSTSRGEGLSYSLIEALAFGIPIVATNVAGHKEMIKNGYNGFLFNTIDEVCIHIHNLKNDKKLYRNIKNNSLREFSNKYVKNNMINKLVDIYLD